MFNKILKSILILSILIFFIVIIAYTIFFYNNYYPLTKTMLDNGFDIYNNNSFSCIRGDKEIIVTFDFENNICNKNQYTFDLENHKKIAKYYFIKKENFESILNGTLNHKDGKIVLEEKSYKAHDWLNFPKLIAHAGGAIRKNHSTYTNPIGNSTYTNSLEALIENYNLGHRLFEFDFYLTSDFQLAAVHDWYLFGNRDGTWLSSDEWKNMKSADSTNKKSTYTTLMLTDILNEMLVNKDIFLITDTKSFDFTDKQIKLQFELIYNEAMRLDPTLLDRIIPQIYNEEMYDIVTSVYDFNSIIYTVYATKDSAENIISFASEKDNIKVITAPFNDSRFNFDAINVLHSKYLNIFMHTINTETDLTQGIFNKIDGFYTDLLLPSDL